MTEPSCGTQPIIAEPDIVLARQVTRRLAQACGLRLVDQTKLVTAASEIARNTLVYGRGGHMDWAIVQRDGRKGVHLLFRDEGPGISDIDLAMTDGWTSGNGLGLGLTGAKRLVDEFSIESAPGTGTRVALTQWS